MEIGRATAVLPFESVAALEAGFAERVGPYSIFLSSAMVEGASLEVGSRVDLDIAIVGGIVALRVLGVIAWHYGDDEGVPAGRESGFGVLVTDVADGRALYDRLLQRHGAGTRVRVPGARIVQRLHLGPSGFVSSRGESAIATGMILPLGDVVAADDDDLEATLAPPRPSTSLNFLDQETALGDVDDATIEPKSHIHQVPASQEGRLAVLAAALASGSSEGVDGPTLDGDHNAPPRLLSLPEDALSPLTATVVGGPVEGASSLLGLEPPSDSDSGEGHSAFSQGPPTTSLPSVSSSSSSSSDEALFPDVPPTGLAELQAPTASGTQSQSSPSEHGPVAAQRGDERAQSGAFVEPAMMALLAEALDDDDDDDDDDGVAGASDDDVSVTAPRPSERSLRRSTDALAPPMQGDSVALPGDDLGVDADDDGEATIDRVVSDIGPDTDAASNFASLPSDPSAALDPSDPLGGGPVGGVLDDGVLDVAALALDDDIGRAVDAFSGEGDARAPVTPPPSAELELASFPEAPPADKPFEAQSTDVDLLASISAADVIALDDGPSEAEERGIDDALVSVDADLIDSEAWPDASPFEPGLSLDAVETELFSSRLLPPPMPWPEWSDLIDARTMGVSFSFSKRGQAHLEFFSWPVTGTKRYSGTGQGESSDPRRQRTSIVPMADGLDSDAPPGDDDDDVFSGPSSAAPAGAPSAPPKPPKPPALATPHWDPPSSGQDPFEQQGTDPRMNVEGLVARHVRASHRDVSDDGDLFDDVIPELDTSRGPSADAAGGLDRDVGVEPNDDNRDETMDEMRLPALALAAPFDGIESEAARRRAALPPSWPVTSSGEGAADNASDESSES